MCSSGSKKTIIKKTKHVNAIEKNHSGGDETTCFDIFLL